MAEAPKQNGQPGGGPSEEAKNAAKIKKANAAASRDKHRQIEKAHRDRMRQLMHDLARHVYNGNRTEEELSNMTRGDILMAAKECITQLRRKLGAARTVAPPNMPPTQEPNRLTTSAVPMNPGAAGGMPPQQMIPNGTTYAGPGSISSGDARSSAVAALMGGHAMQRPAGPPSGMPSDMPPQQQLAPGQATGGPPSTMPSQAASITKSVTGQQQPPSVMSAPAAGWQGGAGNTVDTQGRRDTGLSGGPLSVWSANDSFRHGGAVPAGWQSMPGWGSGGHGQPVPVNPFGNGSVHGGSMHGGSVHSMPQHMMQAGNWQGMYPGGPMLAQMPGQPVWQHSPYAPAMPHMVQGSAGAAAMPASAPMTAAMQQQAAAVAAAAAVGGVRRMQPSGGAAMPTQGAAKRARAADT